MPEINIEYKKVDDEKRKLRLETYARFLGELKKKDITPYRVHKDTGIATATLSDWKNGISMPKQEKLQKIADYFGVTVDYLMTGENNRYSSEDALLDVYISEDFELKEAIKKYYALDDRKKKHVLELINLLSIEQ